MNGRKLGSLVMAVVLLVSTFLVAVTPVAANTGTPSFAQPSFEEVVVRGSEAPLRWDGEDHPLTYDEINEVWVSAPITFQGGVTIEYKFVRDGNWMDGDNLTFTTPQSGDYEFVFHPTNERQVEVRPATEYDGSITLQLELSDATPNWVVPTVASSLNRFNYDISPMERIEDGLFELTIAGPAGEEIEYRYGLGSSRFQELSEERRSAVFSEEGTVVTDQVDAWTGLPVASNVVHNYQHEPYVVSPGEEVEITVTVDHFGPITNGAAYVTVDGTRPDGARGAVQNGNAVELTITETEEQENGEWQSTLQGTVPAQTENTRVKYVIDVWDADGEGSQFADTNALNSTDATEFAYYVENYTSPDWAKEASIYHIFVDRFKDGDESINFDVDSDLPLEEALKDWMGGDLQGIIDELDYIEELGVNTLWISPVFDGPYSHGYHPADFFEVDRNFGDIDVLRNLVDEVHERDMKIIYDFVPNHTSNQHPFFQDALENGEESPYYDWYTFYEDGSYETFYGIGELPQLNNDNEETRAYMMDEVIPFWLEDIGFDGFRLDYAKGPSQSFWVDFRHTVKEIDEDLYLFGEIWDNRDVISEYQGKLDGALDFSIRGTMIDAFGPNERSFEGITRYVEENEASYHPEYIMNTFLDSHDESRILFELNEDTDALKLASFTQFALPGAPIIYYGTEVGMSQSEDHRPFTEWQDRWYREMMVWDEADQNRDLFTHYQSLLDVRADYASVLSTGDYEELYAGQDILAFERSNEEETLVAFLKRPSVGETVTLPMVSGDATIRDAFTGQVVSEISLADKAFGLYVIDGEASFGDAQTEQITFTDFGPDSMYYDDVRSLLAAGVIKGFEDGSFKPTNTITRLHAGLLLERMLGLENEGDTSAPFTDISTSHPYVNSLHALKAEGIFLGDDQGRFLPSNGLTRGEAAAILVRAFELEATEESGSFADTVGHQFEEEIAILVGNGMAQGRTNEVFDPQAPITRVELALLLSRM
ncbi:S-layer homology domain-containing protein [Paenalkalicoccus suaedae]|uniref:S-layer homology domain-containing protein n=1 Tax=Paenalkalicoccus suaedae TaxID=2592382 RepID=A0A859FC69_9BACI|nr:alpha-amylase family glycosyl hydrolase [Paenalkalicoccus suaedae]QKS70657.1 S-layer homology domain-containing protein [Paenalkalicoccus suaedae]